jgi:hypothetical protein
VYQQCGGTLSGSFTVATGVIWSGGAGSYDPSTTNQNITYTPTAAEIASGSVTLTLTTTGNGNCLAVTDQVTLTFTPGPTANAGANSSACANNATINLNGSVTVATGGTWSGGTGVVHPEQHHAQRHLHTHGIGDRGGFVDVDIDHHGQWDLSASYEQPHDHLHASTYGERRCERNGVRQQQCDHLEWVGGRCNRRDMERWHRTYAPNANTLNAVYTPSAAERTAGTVTR